MQRFFCARSEAAACAALLFCLAAFCVLARPVAGASPQGEGLYRTCYGVGGDFLDSEQALSVVWQELKASLPKKQFAALLNEQRAWLKERDRQAAGAAGALQGRCDAYARENRKRIAALERRLPYAAQAPAPAPAPAPDNWADQPAPPAGGK